tara:strand:+ start:1967 stop:2485 length:519 start_codon:yes stop_codon:yes gene_type:complete
MRIAITGHRPNKLGNDYNLKSDLIHKIKKSIVGCLVSNATSVDYKENRPYKLDGITCITGMALGIDTLFALIAVEYNIPFIAALPCLNQDKMWTSSSKVLYNKLIGSELCTTYHVSNQEYTLKCMQNRNKWMVDNCDLLIAVWNSSPGGTANCVRYAKSQNKEMVIINPLEL